MGFQNMQDQSTGLVLCKHAKQRLMWTPELHQRFVVAVNELGGTDKATPKSLMRAMEIPGLTLYHKFKLGKNQQSEPCTDFKEDFRDAKVTPSRDDLFSGQVTSDAADDGPKNGSLCLADALQMQIEVQQKLHEQIELRIEAQGKYLQKVLQKAQQTLAGYSPFPPEEEKEKEVSNSIPMVSSRCFHSSFSDSTEVISSTAENLCQRKPGGSGSSNDCSSTSLEISAKEEEDPKQRNGCPGKMSAQTQVMQPSWISVPSIDDNDRKRSGSFIRSGDREELPAAKRSSTCREKV